MKNIVPVMLLLAMVLVLCACGKEESVTTTTQTKPVTESTTQPVTETTTSQVVTSVPAKITVATEQTTKSTMLFTDAADNKFISAISSAYGIDPSRLACIYTSSGENRNYVWQFQDSKDENGKIIKTSDTLEYVYTVSADCASIQRTAGKTGNIGCSSTAGIIVFEAAKQMFIPKFQSQLY